MNIENKRILVTGAGGFIGSHLTERLLQTGSKVTAFLRYNSRSDFGFLNKVEHDNLEILQGDLRDQHSVMGAVRDKDIVFHLGALIAIPYSYINPWDAFETNVKGTLNILTAANHFEVKKVVNTSTSETYGTAKYVPINEEHPLQGQSPYSASKIASDKFVESYISTYGLPVSTLRPFNTYGPRQSSRAVIPTIITQVLTQDFLKLGSLSPTRDFTFVKDTVEGFVKVAESDKTIGEVTNIGSGAEISIGHIAKKIVSLIGKEIQIKEDAIRKRPSKSEVHRLVCDNSKAKKLFDWEPSHSLDEGLEITINWIRDNLDIYDPKNYTV